MSTNPGLDPFDAGPCAQPKPPAPRIPTADSDLLRQMQLHDEHAIADLYDRYSNLIFRVANQVLHDPAASEDVAQEIFLQLWRTPEAFDAAKGSLEAWLTIVSRRRAIDRMRARREEIDVADVVVPVNARQLADATGNRIAERVKLLLRDMPKKLRIPFELAYAQGLTHHEISLLTGDPLGTTKSRIRLALNFIRKKLDSNHTDSNGNDHAR